MKPMGFIFGGNKKKHLDKNQVENSNVTVVENIDKNSSQTKVNYSETLVTVSPNGAKH